MEKTIEIPEGYEARIEGNKVILEPKESEDERIRKRLVEYFHGVYDKHTCLNNANLRWEGLEVKRVIAYLERQQPVQDREEREYVRTLKSLIADFLRDKEDVNRGYYQDIYDWLDGRHIEQKPAEWSEEDEKNLKLAYDLLVNGVEADRRYPELISWLKSLRPQPKSGLDKTDKVQLLQIIEDGVTKSLCKKGFHFHFNEEYAKDLIEYICSFNLSKSNWKPSEEQMEALMLAIEGKWDAIKPTGYMSRRLEDLYNGIMNTFGVECKLEE